MNNEFHKNSSFKILIGFLILLTTLQACASKTVFYAEPESKINSTSLIKRLEMLGEGPNKVVLKALNEKHKVKRFHKISSDSVYFQLKNDRIVAYKIDEVKSYQISKRKTGAPIIGPILLTASVLSRGAALRSDDFYTGIGLYYGSLILGLVSLGVTVIEFTITDRDIIYFTATQEDAKISMTANE